MFGMTKQSWRICIQSYARHHPEFAQKKQGVESERYFDEVIAKKV